MRSFFAYLAQTRRDRQAQRLEQDLLRTYLVEALRTLQESGGVPRHYADVENYGSSLLKQVQDNTSTLHLLAEECRNLHLKVNAFYEPRSAEGLFRALQDISQKQTVDIVRSEMQDAVCILDHRTFLRHVMTFATEGVVLEFGVYSGTTINWMAADHPNRQFYGFDTFLGLPESWAGYEHYDFNREGEAPSVGPNVQLIKGLFSETIPNYLAANQDTAVVHVDCDLYSSTVSIFAGLGHTLKSGCVLIFDEYFNYPNFEHHERKALQEFLDQNGAAIRWIAFSGQRAAGILSR